MDESRVEGRAVVLDGEVVDEAAFAANAAPPSPSFDPDVVLAEALKRFPFPKLPVAAAARATPQVPPGPIIEAALKAAGLMRS